MATVTTPVPPPVKNDWLSSGLDNPRLSPPSPGGPRKGTPPQQVRLNEIHTLNFLLNLYQMKCNFSNQWVV